jgi:regulator of protease activity HflC (stomatin/prohibitin superfamily)
MFDRLIDLVVEFIELFQVIVFIDHYEKGVVLRRGKFHRVVDPGWRWIQPAGQDEVLVANVKPEPMYLDVQSLHTADDYACNIQVGIIWRIVDIKTFLLENEDTEDIVGMLCSGVVTRSIHKNKWTALREDRYPDSLAAPMNRKVRKRGAEIDEVVVQDFAAGHASRIWHEGIALDMGED